MVASWVSPKARKGISSDIAGRGGTARGADETRSAPLLRGPPISPDFHIPPLQLSSAQPNSR
jgi:hypothetical protein